MKRSPVEKDILWKFHLAGRHIHGFFVFVTNGERKYLAELFNNFLFPIDVDYEDWDIRLKIAFDRVSVYNLQLYAILEGNNATFKKIGRKFYEPYEERVSYNLKGGLNPFEMRQCKTYMANYNMFKEHTISICGIKQADYDRYLRNSGHLLPSSSLKTRSEDAEVEKNEEPSVSRYSLFNIHKQPEEFKKLALFLLRDRNVKELLEENKENLEILCENNGMEYGNMVSTVEYLSKIQETDGSFDNLQPFFHKICKAFQYYDNDNGKYWKFNLSIDNGEFEKGDLEESKHNKRKAVMDSEVPVKKARKAPAPKKRSGRPRKQAGGQKEDVPEAKKNREEPSDVPHVEDMESRNQDVDQNPAPDPVIDEIADEDPHFFSKEDTLSKLNSVTEDQDVELLNSTDESTSEEVSPPQSQEIYTENLEWSRIVEVDRDQDQDLIENPDQIDPASEGKDSSGVDSVPAELPQEVNEVAVAQEVSAHELGVESDAPEASNSKISSNQSESDVFNEACLEENVTLESSIEKSSTNENSEVRFPLFELQSGTSDAPDQECIQGTSRSASEMDEQEPAHVQDSEVVKLASENDPVSPDAAVDASQEPGFFNEDVEPIAQKSGFEMEPALASENVSVSPEDDVDISQDAELEPVYDQDSEVVTILSEVNPVSPEADMDISQDPELESAFNNQNSDDVSPEPAEDVHNNLDCSTHSAQIDLAPEVNGSPEAAVIVDALVERNSEISSQDSEVEVAQLQNSFEAPEIVDAQKAQDQEYLQLNPAHLQLLANFRLRNIFGQFPAQFSTPIPEVEASVIVDDVIMEHDQEAPRGLSTQGTSSEIRSFSEVVEQAIPQDQTSVGNSTSDSEFSTDDRLENSSTSTENAQNQELLAEDVELEDVSQNRDQDSPEAVVLQDQEIEREVAQNEESEAQVPAQVPAQEPIINFPASSDQDFSKKKANIEEVLKRIKKSVENWEETSISIRESDLLKVSEDPESSTSNSEDNSPHQELAKDMVQDSVAGDQGSSEVQEIQDEKPKIPKIRLRKFNQYWKIIAPEESVTITPEAEDRKDEEIEENPTSSTATFENDKGLDFHYQHLERRAQMVSQGDNAQDAPNPTTSTSNDLDFHRQHIRNRAAIVSKEFNADSTIPNNADDVFQSIFSISPEASKSLF